MMITGTSRWVLLVLVLLLGCEPDRSSTGVVRQAVAIESGDECHLCGMLIQSYPGPKGELYQRGSDRVYKFCSTRDLFAYLLDPEHRHSVQQVFVHDMARTPWQQPRDEHLVDGRQAWYVVGHSRRGAMGPTLASFTAREHADAFARQYGGGVYGFGEITLDMLNNMVMPPDDMQGKIHH